MEKSNLAKVGAIAAAALVIGSAGTVALNQGDVSQDQLQVLIAEAQAKAFTDGAASVEPLEIVKEVKVEVPVEKIVTVDKIVTVEDTEMLQLLCERAMYDDLMECKEEINAEDSALKLALVELKAQLGEELEDASIVEDERDVRIVKVYSDFEDIEVSDSDFDADEYSFDVKVKVEDKDLDEKFEVLVSVDVEDGEAKISDVSRI